MYTIYGEQTNDDLGYSPEFLMGDGDIFDRNPYDQPQGGKQCFCGDQVVAVGLYDDGKQMAGITADGQVCCSGGRADNGYIAELNSRKTFALWAEI